MAISASIITLNEEKNIADCINSVKQAVDEVVVVDSESTDRTVEIAQSLGAKVVIQAYLGDGPQKAFAGDQASYDWVLSIDADERLDDELIATIRQLDLEKNDLDHYAINRKTFVGNEWIRVWYPDYVIRLYNRKTARYQAIKGHSKVEGKKSGRLNGHILHYSFDDYNHLLDTTSKFAKRSARMLIEKNKPIGPFSPITHAVSGFLRKFILKKGFLYGSAGLTVSITTAFGSYMKYLIARDYQRKKRNG